jgi:hypothetical protein
MTATHDDDLCHARLRVALHLAEPDPQLSPPCPQCVAALAKLLNVQATSMDDIRVRIKEATVHA